MKATPNNFQESFFFFLMKSNRFGVDIIKDLLLIERASRRHIEPLLQRNCELLQTSFHFYLLLLFTFMFKVREMNLLTFDPLVEISKFYKNQDIYTDVHWYVKMVLSCYFRPKIFSFTFYKYFLYIYIFILWYIYN